MSRTKIHIKDYSGTFCGDGDKASLLLNTKIDPLLDKNKELIIDFKGVRNMNSSFANALIANLVILKGPEILEKVYFSNCNKKVKAFIEIAVSLGLKRYKENKILA